MPMHAVVAEHEVSTFIYSIGRPLCAGGVVT